MAEDFYLVLGLARTASAQEIRERFLELARERHPDRFQGEAKVRAEREFQAITQAFNVLSNPDSKRLHDATLVQPVERRIDAAAEAARAYLQRGVRAYRAERFREAAENFRQATEQDPASAKAWYHLALAASRRPDRLRQAVAASARACTLDPRNAVYLKLAGELHGRSGLRDEALRFLTEALTWSGGDPEVEALLESLGEKGRGGGKRGRS